MRSLILSLCLATPAWAETPLNADAFEALVEGKTLTFSNTFGPYGVEYYAPNRRVIWSFVGGECISGEWYEAPGQNGPEICFLYENDDTPKCWEVFEEDGKIRADFANSPGSNSLYEAVEAEPLICGDLNS